MQNSKLKKTFNCQGGQSLFEVVVAVAISALVVVVLVSLATVSIKNSGFSNNKARAATYAQEATDWLRGQRDSDVGAFITNVNNALDTKRCLNTLAWVISSCAGATINDTPFQRYVVFSVTPYNVNGVIKNVMTADTTVSWTDSGGLHEVTSATNFSDWRQR